jgi:hypothetical protein
MEDRKKKFQKIIEEYKKKREMERIEHPERFVPRHPYELFGVECREGWKSLYQPIIDYIEKYNNDKDDNDKIEIHQIKEKFGGLRIYLGNYNKIVREMARKAEDESYNICEECGKHIDKPIVENHWIYAECDDCHKKYLERKFGSRKD